MQGNFPVITWYVYNVIHAKRINATGWTRRLTLDVCLSGFCMVCRMRIGPRRFGRAPFLLFNLSPDVVFPLLSLSVLSGRFFPFAMCVAESQFSKTMRSLSFFSGFSRTFSMIDIGRRMFWGLLRRANVSNFAIGWMSCVLAPTEGPPRSNSGTSSSKTDIEIRFLDFFGLFDDVDDLWHMTWSCSMAALMTSVRPGPPSKCKVNCTTPFFSSISGTAGK